MRKFFYLLSALLVSFMTSCTTDGDETIGGGGSGTVTPPENTIEGTWINTVDDDKRYLLVFRSDGSGSYMVEGVKELNFTTFSKADFKYTTAKYASSSATSSVGLSGSVEINFIGSSSSSEVGTFALVEGKLQLDGFKKIDKTIFAQTTALPTSLDIQGLWFGENTGGSTSSRESLYTAMLKVGTDGAGYCNTYQKSRYIDGGDASSDDYSFSGGVLRFSSYDVTGDIITFKDYDANRELSTKAIMRYKKNDVGGFAISVNGGPEVTIATVKSTPTDITTNVRGLWLDTDEENVLYLSQDNRLIYLKKSNNTYNTSNFNVNSNDTIRGTYSLLDYNICIDKSYTVGGKVYPAYQYILAEVSSSSTYMGIYDTGVYCRFGKTNESSSQLQGVWEYSTEEVGTEVDDAVIDNNYDYYAPAYRYLEFSANNALYMKENQNDKEYATGLYIASNGRLFMIDTDGNRFRKQYSWEKSANNKLYLKYEYNGQDHIAIYRKMN